MAEYEEFLATGDVARFVAAYAGRHDPLDALWWLSHPLEAAPSGTDAPASARAGLQAAAYSRDGGAEAELALARLERQLAEDREATLAALAVARAPLPEPAAVAEELEPEPLAEVPRRRRGWAALAIGLAVVLVVGAVVAVRPLLVPTAQGSAAPTSVSSLTVSGSYSAPSTAPSVSVASYEGSASCYNLLDVDTLNFIGMKGFEDISDRYAAAIDSGSPLYPFVAQGGLVCAWGDPFQLAYAYAPLSVDDAANEEARLTQQNSFTVRSRKGVTQYSGPGQVYTFGKGYWVYSTTKGEGVGDLTDQLIAHVPENAGKKRTDLQSAVYVTSEGLGDLRIGKPVPSTSKLVAWNPKACSSGVGAWGARKPFAGIVTGVGDFSLVTADGKRDGAVDTVMINSPSIPTKSGIRVGDSRQKVEKAFPKIANSDYALSSSTGKIKFEIGSLDPGHPDDQIVIAIWVTTIGGKFPVEGTDGNGPCPA